MIKSENKKILKATSILTVADFIGKIFDFIRIILITSFFSPAIFGIYSLAIDTNVFFSCFILPGLSSIIIKYFPEYVQKNRKKAAKFFSTVFFILILKSIILAFLIYIASNYIALYYLKPELDGLIKYSSILIILIPLNVSLQQFVNSSELFLINGLSRIICSISGLFFLILFYLLGYNEYSLIISYLLSNLLQIIVLLYPMRKYFTFSSFQIDKEILKYWYPLVLANLMKNISGNLHTFIIGRFVDKEGIGLFKIAEKSVNIGFSFVDPYINSIQVIAFNTFNKSKERFIQIINVHNKFSSFLITFTAIIGLLGAKFFFQLLYGDDYLLALPYFIYFLLAGVMGASNLSFLRPILFAHKKTNHYFKFITIYSIIQLFFLVILTIKFQIWGIIYALIIGRMIGTIMGIIICRRLEKKLKIVPIVFPAALWSFLFFLSEILNYIYHIETKNYIYFSSSILFLIIMQQAKFIKFSEIYKYLKYKKIKD